MQRQKKQVFVSVDGAVLKPDFARIFQLGNFHHKLLTQELPDLVFREMHGLSILPTQACYDHARLSSIEQYDLASLLLWQALFPPTQTHASMPPHHRKH